MIKKIINRLLRTVRQSSWVTDLRHKRCFPGVAIHTTVNMAVQGHFSCNDGNINSWSQIIVPAGATLALGDGCYIGRNVELGPLGTIRIGGRTSIQDRCIILGDVQIGEHCVFAPNIYISSGLHHFDGQPWSLIKDQDDQAAAFPDATSQTDHQVVIEDDCWIGVNVVIMRGVKIGKGAVVGANAVVTKDVAPYTLVAGVPARELRKRLDFRPPKSIRWDVDENMPYFYSGFQLSQAERAKHVTQGGLAIRHAVCRLALDNEAGEQLAVIVRLSGTAPQAHLCCGGVRHALSGEFCELVFPVSGDTPFLVLETEGLPPSGDVYLIMQSARVRPP